MAMSFLSVLVANSSVMVSMTSGSTVNVLFELVRFWIASTIAITSSLILVISTVEQFSTSGSCQTAGSPSHNLDTFPKVIKESNLVATYVAS